MLKESVEYTQAGLKDLAKIRAFIQESATKLGANNDSILELWIAVNEAITNIILHGYQDEQGWIKIKIVGDGHDFLLHLLDSAPPFDPTSVPMPDVTLPFDQRPYGGMGIQMMRSFTDELSYRLTGHGMNELTFTKRGAIEKEPKTKIK